MSDKLKILTDKEAAEARARTKRAIASCAIEGIEFTTEELAFIESLENKKLGYDEFRVQLNEWLQRKWKSEGK